MPLLAEMIGIKKSLTISERSIRNALFINKGKDVQFAGFLYKPMGTIKILTMSLLNQKERNGCLLQEI